MLVLMYYTILQLSKYVNRYWIGIVGDPKPIHLVIELENIFSVLHMTT